MVGPLLPGDPTAVGRYRLLGRLGAGGMGQVFLGQSPGGRLVAVKLIRPDLAGDPDFRRRFAREVSAARNVSGLFTALVVDADPDASVPWLATAYVAGPSLTQAVEEYGALPSPSVAGLAAGLAEGLAAIHAAGVVHRDLKPSNVLLAHDGPRVIDFGISRAMESTMLTQTGMVMGSPGFMSPEQASGAEVGPPSDIFSLGAVLTFAATGEGPFGAGPTPALVYRVVTQAPDLTRVPEELRPVIGRCLSKNPAERPTANQLLAELGGSELVTDWLPAPVAASLNRFGAPAPTQDVGPIIRDGRRTRPINDTDDGGSDRGGGRNRWWLVAAIAAVTALAAGGIGYALTASGSGQPVATPSTHVTVPAVRTTTSTSPTPSPSSTVRTGVMPNVQGDILSDAEAALKTNGFDNYSWLYVCAGSQDISDVVSQTPAPGSKSALTAPIHIDLQANNCLTMPNVVGFQLSNAESTLEGLGFAPASITWRFNCYKGNPPISQVMTQTPAAGTSYGKTQLISLGVEANNCG